VLLFTGKLIAPGLPIVKGRIERRRGAIAGMKVKIGACGESGWSAEMRKPRPAQESGRPQEEAAPSDLSRVSH